MRRPSDDAVPPGAERLYKYPNVQRAATLWYHDHAHGETAQTLYAGLAAFYIVDDPDEEDLELPHGDYDVPLMIQDRSFNADGSFRYRVDLDRGFRGDTILVNGAVAPRMKVERRLYRLRFLNASNARAYTLELGNGRKMIQIASDAGLLTKPVVRRSIPMEPAERVDVVVDFRQFGVGSKVILHNVDGEASTTRSCASTWSAAAPRRRACRSGWRGGGVRRSTPARVAADIPGLAGGGSVWQIAGGGSRRCGSTAARGRARRSCGPGSTTPRGRTRCTCTATTSGSSRRR